MDEVERGQVSRNAADVYEQFFVPALFAEWAERVADAAEIESNHRVLDVACGTGILARTIHAKVRGTGSVAGVDPNDGMLAVARRKSPAIEWHNGVAESLPFADSSFDVVVSQFGLMFFEDPNAALVEMIRVLRPQGRFAIAVWDRLNNTPGYAEMVALLHRLFGERAAAAVKAPYALGDTGKLQSLFASANVPIEEIRTLQGHARFPSIRAWVHTDVRGWTLADMIDDEQFELLAAEAESALQQFVTPTGAVEFASPAHVVVGAKE